MSAPSALASSRLPSEPGTRIMSPKQVKITPGCARDRDAVVHAAHRDHADRAAGPVHEFDVRGQQVVDPVLVDRMRVAAADLHELVVAAGLDRGEDLRREHAAELGVAELVDVLHALELHQGDAGMDEQPVARGDRLDERDLDRALRAVLGRAEREPARVVDALDPHRDALVGAGDAVVAAVVRRGHSITLALSSSSSAS